MKKPDKSQLPARHMKLQQLEWLQGSWANISEEGQFYETWSKVNDSVYSGLSFMIVKEDTVFSEAILLESIGNELFYKVSVSDQNNEQAVSFKLISLASGEFIFENKEHDFPQRIIYKNPLPDSINARIEGTVEGVFRVEEFPMKRTK
ncbi:MAG: hypothetical protein HGA23_02935 [Bacteroidales bacterium]|nr:hypothetical protein [Bacteroidales bacterium]